MRKIFVEVFSEIPLIDPFMVGFFKKIIGLILLALLVASGWVLWRAPDPLYQLEVWRGMGRFTEYDRRISAAAEKQGLDRFLVKALVWKVSAFNSAKVGKYDERGLMQLSRSTGEDWAKAEKIETFIFSDLFDPKTNLDVGTWSLKRAMVRWKGKVNPVPFALADWFAGAPAVDRWVEASGRGEDAQAEDLLLAINIPEVRQSIREIIGRQKSYEKIGSL